ncbi:serine protease Do [Amphritea atlantica]|jgi:serine protease Do|uniref:Probable periplasmic serine endoprotease DegP-like n=1 Tax=Amphritea atlantica TaxID=355243 RepID=A0A1H9HL92_9GAMM|nr:DegQ family serine endoprotease [Amphritea atlantica]SEQ62992.1 serine protease Do [Amphritea atlantica]
MKLVRATFSLVLFWLCVSSVHAALPEFKDLVKQASPAVVNISTVQQVSSQVQGMPDMQLPDGQDIPDIFRHFFRIPEGYGNAPRHKAPQSLGSGFIISEDGYILTNHHVVADADKVIVRLSDRRELEAKIIGSDKRSDVALLKIDATDLPVVKIGDSDKAEVGEWVLAIGSPFGFDHSVTAGIISATDRSLANETYVPFIQTDVAINPGNSGGPLFNMQGEVIGINSQIYTRSGGFMGLSFSIPMNVAMEVVDQLKDKGKVSRGWLGVIIQEVNRDLAESFGLDKPGGALVAKVLPDSPAEAAGIQEGDIIYSFNGNMIDRSGDLPHQVGRIPPETDARVGVVRDGKKQTITVTIGLLPSQGEELKTAGQMEEKASANRLNIQVSELDDQLRERLSVTEGVVVRQVANGAGADSGLMVGDVITMLNGEEIDSVDTFAGVVEALPDNKAVPMRIVRRGSPMFIPLKLK